MYNIDEILAVASEMGLEVNKNPSNNKSGFYYRDENGKQQKWDALTELGLEGNANKYFNKDLYMNKINEFSESPYNGDKQSNYLTHEKNSKRKLITEAA